MHNEPDETYFEPLPLQTYEAFDSQIFPESDHLERINSNMQNFFDDKKTFSPPKDLPGAPSEIAKISLSENVETKNERIIQLFKNTLRNMNDENLVKSFK